VLSLKLSKFKTSSSCGNEQIYFEKYFTRHEENEKQYKIMKCYEDLVGGTMIKTIGV